MCEGEESTADEDLAQPQPWYVIWSKLDRRVVSNALAAAGASIADPLMSLVDTAFVSKLGLVQLAALGPNTAMFNVIFFISFMAMAVVTTDQVASANAKKDRRGVGRAVFTSVTTALAIGLACMAAICLFPEQILAGFQTNAEMMPFARVYAVIRGLSCPATLVMVACQASFLALLDLRTPLIVVVSAGLLNGILDPLMMFPQFLNLGIAGAAWATSLSQYVGAAIFVTLLYKRREEFGLDLALDEAFDRVRGAGKDASFLTKYLTLLPDLGWAAFLDRCKTLALRAVLILSTYTMASMAAANLGTIYIAAHQVIQQVQQLQLNVTWAFLSVGQTMTANVYGSQGAGPARNVANRVIFWGATVSAILGVVTWATRYVVPRLFIADPTVMGVLQTAMLPACVMLAFSWNNALEGCLLGADDQNYVVGTYPWAVGMGLAVLGASFKMGFGLRGIWWSLAVYYMALVAWFGSRFVVPMNKGNL